MYQPYPSQEAERSKKETRQYQKKICFMVAFMLIYIIMIGFAVSQAASDIRDIKSLLRGGFHIKNLTNHTQ